MLSTRFSIVVVSAILIVVFATATSTSVFAAAPPGGYGRFGGFNNDHGKLEKFENAYKVGQIVGKKFHAKYLELRPKSDPGFVVYAEDSDIQKSSYTYYRFLESEWREALGYVTRGGTVHFEVTNVENPVFNPENSAIPVPVGGFRNTVYTGTILSAELFDHERQDIREQEEEAAAAASRSQEAKEELPTKN